jgi:Protein of unknown function (DUF1524)
VREGSSSGPIVPMGRNIILVIASVLILVLTIACSPAEHESNAETTARTGGKTSQTETAKTTQSRTTETSRASGSAETPQALKELKVAQPGSMSSYSREKFRHWSRAENFGWDPPQASCDAREAALIRDGKNVKAGKDCKITSGEWYDPYTDKTYSKPQDLDIDHVVPLANAWRSGASSWNDEQRERYANDPDVLLSVEDNANQAKGDKGPEAWKPPNEAEWCDYAERWVSIKAEYDLSVNEQEKQALEQMLNTCTGR